MRKSDFVSFDESMNEALSVSDCTLLKLPQIYFSANLNFRRKCNAKQRMTQPKDPLNLIPIKVRSVGRAHLACLRCRSHKSKCSGGEYWQNMKKPDSKNCY